MLTANIHFIKNKVSKKRKAAQNCHFCLYFKVYLIILLYKNFINFFVLAIQIILILLFQYLTWLKIS